jgi:hypothetical protein
VPLLACLFLVAGAVPMTAAEPADPRGVAPAIEPLATTTTVTATPGSPRGDQDVRFNVKVSPWVGDGQVMYVLDGKDQRAIRMEHDGTATFTDQLSFGPHTIQMRYAGFMDYAPSTSAILRVTQLGFLATRIAVIRPAGTLKAGGFATFRSTTPLTDAAEVTWARKVAAGLAGPTYRHELQPGRGQVMARLRDLKSRNLTAYSCPVDFTVVRRKVDPTLTTSTPVLDPTQAIRVTFVAGPASSIPAQTRVAFYLDGARDPIKTHDLTDGRTTTSFPFPPVGSHTITARLEPAEWFVPADRTITVKVIRGDPPPPPAAAPGARPSTTTLTVDPAAATWGADAVAHVHVSGANPGRVSLYDGAQQLELVTLDGNGDASVPLRLPPGTHKLVAQHLGTAALAPSRSSSVSVVTAGTATTSVLQVSDATPQLGDPITARITVTPNPGGGRARIDGREVSLDPATGVGELELAELPSGSSIIEARFLGHSPALPSVAQPVTVEVLPVASMVSLDATVGPLSDGVQPFGSVSLRVAIEPEALTDQPSGLVDVFVDGTRVGTFRYPRGTGVGLRLNAGTYQAWAEYRGTRTLKPAVSDRISFTVGGREAAPKALTGTATLRGPKRTSRPVVKLDVRLGADSGPIRAFQISNDGVHWATWLLDRELPGDALGVPWSLIDPTCGGKAADGPRTIRVRFLATAVEELQGDLLIPGGSPVRSEVIMIPVVLDR